jgi:hypothetical protein
MAYSPMILTFPFPSVLYIIISGFIFAQFRKYSAREGRRSRYPDDRENGKLCPFFGGIRI